jgi:GNAT superfamily N-acetyltransferase
VNIRHYHDADRLAVIRLFRQFMDELTLPELQAEFARYVELAIREELGRVDEYYLARPRQGFWVAEDDEVVGMVGIESRTERIAELRRMAVETSRRRRGIGSALLKTAEAFCRESGYDTIELNTSERQTAARRLYEASGYRLRGRGVVAETTHKLIGGLTRYYYEKKL